MEEKATRDPISSQQIGVCASDFQGEISRFHSFVLKISRNITTSSLSKPKNQRILKYQVYLRPNDTNLPNKCAVIGRAYTDSQILLNILLNNSDGANERNQQLQIFRHLNVMIIVYITPYNLSLPSESSVHTNPNARRNDITYVKLTQLVLIDLIDNLAPFIQQL